MIAALLPVLLIVAGALTYGLSQNVKVAELGRLMFQAGTIGIAVVYAGKLVTLLGS